uniref:hypothetical protein n=1 Tax=Pararhizobium sp. IMCC3301 TaxID=3067904 RepID=UPI0027413DFC|nr:hypothetical protein [Pararhizobium sp. IMCC3301]
MDISGYQDRSASGTAGRNRDTLILAAMDGEFWLTTTELDTGATAIIPELEIRPGQFITAKM